MFVPYNYYPPPQETYDDDNYATHNYYTISNYYKPSPFSLSPSSSPTNSSFSNLQQSIFSEYLSTGFTSDFLQKYQRELTIIASSVSVIILIIIGACLWCIVGIVRRGFNKKNGDLEDNIAISTSSSSGATPPDKKSSSGGDELDLSCCGSDGSARTAARAKRAAEEQASSSSKKWCGGGSSKGIPIISKLFSRQNGNSANILAQHRNIITPDRSIPFIVPTIQLPAQPPEAWRKPDGSIFLDPHSPRTSSSQLLTHPSSSSTAGKQHQALLLAQQFYPQLEHPESDSCPLIAFSLYYELASQILNVRLLEGRNFPDTLVHTVAVKVYPGRSAKQHTKEFKCRSPVYNQEFCFHLRQTSLQTKILKLRAVIPGNPKRVIGYVNVALKDLPGFDKVMKEGEGEIREDLKTTQLWRRVELPNEGGDGVKLQVSLKWSPEPGPGLLTLKIIEAAGLHENRECDYTSSYVKVTLQEQGRNIKTRKTQLVRWGSVPLFDDVFVLTVPRELLSQISFLLVVIARGRLGSKAVLGKLCVGSVPYAVTASSGGIATAAATAAASSSSSSSVVRATSGASSSSSTTSSSGIEFWEDMCHQPDLEIIRWLHLLP